MDEVIDGIWIGDISDAQEEPLSDYGIRVVITVCQDSVEDNVGCEYYHYNMSDGPDNKYGGRYDYEFFAEAVNTLVEAIEKDKKVFIHCHKGQSRSASVLIAALGRIHNIDYGEAESMVESSRPQINPDDILVDNAKQYIANYSS